MPSIEERATNPFSTDTDLRRLALTLIDDRDEQLAPARLVGAAGRMIEIAVERKATGRLLEYLYGKGRRRVVIESDGVRLPGRLTTEWSGHRRWFVQLGMPPER
ncbi:hypothetical protein J0H33_03990 [bacterium]|nr:hypothetical protein [bacterium]